MDPVDLMLIKKKLTEFEYIVLEQWLDEMMLLFDIVILYEKRNHSLVQKARSLC